MGGFKPARKDARDTVRYLSDAEITYLKAGLKQAGGKLPLFDSSGQRVDPDTMRSCIRKGLCAPWFANPMKPDWMVCRLTQKGREVLL